MGTHIVPLLATRRADASLGVEDVLAVGIVCLSPRRAWRGEQQQLTT